MSALFELRVEIDECDRQIAELLARRSRAVARIHELKAANGQNRRDESRERRVVVGAIVRHEAVGGCYGRDTIEAIWRSIFDGCEHLQAAVPSPVDGGDRGGPRF